jgi:diamine N-acetyltransferase
MNIIKASKGDVAVIQDIATRTWFVTYGPTHSMAQLDYMLAKYYSITALEEDILNKDYFIFHDSGVEKGFISMEHHYLNQPVTKIHRLYILPEFQNEGIGKKLIQFTEKESINNLISAIELNVNRLNKAKTFYEKNGFEVIKTIDIEIGEGYLMEDFVMRKKIN